MTITSGRFSLLLTVSSVVLTLLLWFCMSLYHSDSPGHSLQNPLDGCTYVYLDMGTNIGYLSELESHYNHCGYKVIINTLTGVGVTNTRGKFARLRMRWQLSDMSRNISEIKVERIAQYINEVVAKRKIPPGREGAVVMKLDVEGGEMEIMADLIMSGALAHLDNIHVDWPIVTIREEDYRKFDEKVELVKDKEVIAFRDAVTVIHNMSSKLDLSHKTEILNFDDETFVDFKYYFSC